MKNLHQFLLGKVGQPKNFERDYMTRELLMIFLNLVQKSVDTAPRTETPTD